MNKIASSGMILLADAVITGCEFVDAVKNPKKFLWRAAGMTAVTYGVFKWHMGIIHKAQAERNSQEVQEITDTDGSENDTSDSTTD